MRLTTAGTDQVQPSDKLSGMRKLILAGVLALAVFGFTPNALASTQQASVPRTSSTTVKWVFADGLCMDANASVGARAWQCNGSAAQAWGGVDTVFGNKIELIPASATRYCLWENHSYNGAQVSLRTTCNNAAADKSGSWYLVARLGGWELVNGWSRLCLQDANNVPHVVLTVWKCNGSASQEISPFSLGNPI